METITDPKVRGTRMRYAPQAYPGLAAIAAELLANQAYVMADPGQGQVVIPSTYARLLAPYNPEQFMLNLKIILGSNSGKAISTGVMNSDGTTDLTLNLASTPSFGIALTISTAELYFKPRQPVLVTFSDAGSTPYSFWVAPTRRAVTVMALGISVDGGIGNPALFTAPRVVVSNADDNGVTAGQTSVSAESLTGRDLQALFNLA